MPLYKLTPALYANMVKFFNTYAVNGILGKRELRAILTMKGQDPTDAELVQMIEALSVRSDGIDFQAFLDFGASIPEFRDSEHEYAEAFRMFDKDNKGHLTTDNIKYVLEKVGAKIDVEQLLKVADADGDGTIDYEEFINLMKIIT